MTSEATSAALAVLADAGITGDDARTALRALLTQLGDPPFRGLDELVAELRGAHADRYFGADAERVAAVLRGDGDSYTSYTIHGMDGTVVRKVGMPPAAASQDGPAQNWTASRTFEAEDETPWRVNERAPKLLIVLSPAELGSPWLQINDPETGELAFAMDHDGTTTIGPAFNPDENARQFLDALAALLPPACSCGGGRG